MRWRNESKKRNDGRYGRQKAPFTRQNKNKSRPTFAMWEQKSRTSDKMKRRYKVKWKLESSYS